MAYIHAAPGVTARQVTVKISREDDTTDTLLSIPALQDVTINAANDLFTWSQLDETAKKQVATTSTNSVTMNIVLDPDTFFGTGTFSASGTAANNGLFSMSQQKDLINFQIDIGDTTAKSIEGQAYISGLAPATTADAPVWVSPITLTVTGDFTTGTNVT
jgi:hypothetical protein